jgi:zinc-binding alcohol dehydrogenase family protein
MKAIVTTGPRPASDPQSLIDTEIPRPVARGRDLLVRVEAVSINPVDTKIRASAEATPERPRVLGWDAAGVVQEAGPDATLFRPGDEVYYAGDLSRPGSNAEYQLVDERLVGRKPKSLSFAEAAAFPLVAITAWESLFERLGFQQKDNLGNSLLIIGGAGGVGSMTIQLASRAGLTVIATASRPESEAWVRSLGAREAVNHRHPLGPQLAALGHREVDAIANFSNTDAYWSTMVEVIRPMGKIVSIVETENPVDLGLLKPKSATFAWEFMFTRSQFQTPDQGEQGRLLSEVADAIDRGEIRSLATTTLDGITAENLRKAHALAESGTLVGKLVISGWKS